MRLRYFLSMTCAAALLCAGVETQVFGQGYTGSAAAAVQAAQDAPAAAPADVAGKWHFVLETPGGDREIEANFTLAGEEVSGTWGTSPVKGTFHDGTLKLEFSMTSEEAGVTAPMKINGKYQGGKLTGTWAFSEYDGNFTASRPK